MSKNKSTNVLQAAYRYRPLPNPSQYIRLLQISQDVSIDDGDDDPFHGVRCRLSAWKIDEAPKYHAVSYTWGADTVAGTINVEGEATGVMGVRGNLKDALLQLLHLKSSKFYWIDALCIDQLGLLEKGQQVAMMGSIFRNAAHVLVCLGPPDDDSDRSMRMISQRLERGIKRSAFDVLKTPGTLTKNNTATSSNAATSSPLAAWDSYAMSLAALSRRPYFSRLWVVQELILAKDASFCCGRYHIPFEPLKSEISAASSYASAHQHLREYDSLSAGALMPTATYDSTPSTSKYAIEQNCNRLLHLRDSSSWDRSEGSGQSIPFGLLELLGGLQCEDPRDRIYGALALINPGLRTEIKPNYAASLDEIAIDMLRCGLKLSLFGELVRCLDLDIDNTDLQAAVLATYRLSGHKIKHNGLLELRGRGQLLSRSCGLWTRRDHAIEVKVHSTSPSDHDFGEDYVALDVLLPLHAREGDWVLDPGLTVPSEPYGQKLIHTSEFGLLLRRTNNRFDIIGRVKHLSPPRSHDSDSISLMLDQQAFLTYLAFDKLPDTVDATLCPATAEELQDGHTSSRAKRKTKKEKMAARAQRQSLNAEIASIDRKRRRNFLKTSAKAFVSSPSKGMDLG